MSERFIVRCGLNHQGFNFAIYEQPRAWYGVYCEDRQYQVCGAATALYRQYSGEMQTRCYPEIYADGTPLTIVYLAPSSLSLGITASVARTKDLTHRHRVLAQRQALAMMLARSREADVVFELRP